MLTLVCLTLDSDVILRVHIYIYIYIYIYHVSFSTWGASVHNFSTNIYIDFEKRKKKKKGKVLRALAYRMPKKKKKF